VLGLLAFLGYTYEQTRAAMPVGIAVLVNFLPSAVAMPLLRHWIHRRDPRRLAMQVAWVQAALAAGMAVVVHLAAPLPLLYVMSAVLWLLAMIARIALVTLMPVYLAADRLKPANLTLQVASQAGAVTAALALYLHGDAGWTVLFVLDAATFAAQALIFLLVLPGDGSGRRDAAEPGAAPKLRLAARHVRMVLLLPAGFMTINVLNAAIPLAVFETLRATEREYAAASAVLVLGVTGGVRAGRPGAGATAAGGRVRGAGLGGHRGERPPQPPGGRSEVGSQA
jgi:hypothetical protein